MGGEPAVRPQRGRHPCGFAAKELEQSQYGVNVVKGGTTRCSGLRNVSGARDNLRCPMCVKGVVVVPRRSDTFFILMM